MKNVPEAVVETGLVAVVAGLTLAAGLDFTGGLAPVTGGLAWRDELFAGGLFTLRDLASSIEISPSMPD